MIPVDIFIRKLWTTVVNKFEEEKNGKKMNHTHKSLVMSYGSYTKDFNRVGVWGVKLEFYENGRFIKSTF